MKELYIIMAFGLVCLFYKENSAKESALPIGTTQILRAVACILIVFGHCTSIDRSSILVNLNFGWYCVAVFMFISGWGIAISYKKKKNYLQNFWNSRLIKIFVPFLSLHVLYGIVKNIYGIRYTVRDVFFGLLGQCTIVNNSWYPIAILILYFLFWFTFHIPVTDRKRSIILTALVVVVTYAEYVLLGEEKDWWFISNFAFALGVLLQIWDENLLHIRKYFITAIAGYGFAYCLIPVFNRLLNGYNPVVYILASNLRSMFLCLALVMIAGYFKPRNKWLEIIGNISYEVYLIHGLFILVFSHYFENIVLVFTLTICCSLTASYFLNTFHKHIM